MDEQQPGVLSRTARRQAAEAARRHHHGHQPHKKHRGWKIFLLVLLTLLVLAGTAAGVAWAKYGGQAKQAITDGYTIAATVKRADFSPKQPTVVKDKNGQVIRTLSPNQPIYLKYAQINPGITKGLVAVEDRRFYEHHGVDPYAVVRSLVSVLRRRQVQGGSTLTQQLVKNDILKDQSQTPMRKVREMVIAQELEKKFSKHDILEFYLNDTYFGHGQYGIGSAAKYYFNTDQSKLTLNQIALLVGIPNNPTLYDPLNNPTGARNRRNTVLYVWQQQGLIGSKVFARESAKPLGLNVTNTNTNSNITDNYAVSYALTNATEALMSANGFTFQYAFKDTKAQQNYNAQYNRLYQQDYAQLLNGGYVINTTIDMGIQQKIEQLASQTYAPYTAKDSQGRLQPQVASTVVDNQTGDVLAIIGGRSPQNDQVNRALSARPFGSTAKPIVAYAEAFSRGYTPMSTMVDKPVTNVNGQPLQNYYAGYHGSMTLRHALEDSVNTVAFQLAAQDTQKSYYEKLGQMQFSAITPSDLANGPAMALGSFRTNTTEMAGAYSTFSRSGQFIAPSNLTTLYDSYNRRTVFQNGHEKKNVFSANASYMMINTMQGVLKNGLGKAAALNNYPYTAGKTGTTDNYHDISFVGLTPRFTIANWTGYDSNNSGNNGELTESMQMLPMALFKAEGQYLVSALKETKTDFPMPSTIRKVGNNNLEALPEKQKKTANDVITADLSQLASERKQANADRLTNLDYRLIYHLSKKEEDKREKVVRTAIADFNDQGELPSLKKYDTWLKQIQDIRYKNQKVRRQSAKRSFDDQLNHLVRDLNYQQALLQEEESNAKLAKYNQQKAAIESERDKERQAKLAELQSQYDTQLAATRQAYETNASDKETQRQKLISIMNEIRSYGGSAPDVTLNVPSDNSASSSTRR
ncbi:transglycosylase domain-containing protein [Schleiferilactobacillus shenzhenensis]|uniref:transglycosylase domain-containing protein n=1 Tax=Schleiferilactobacillus shenzhenensis TaxID=1231337 RepID=UPI000413C64C|nr:transglycosylase domain-containing protein [Schleiferilactobacillus shenzhenensis]